MPGVSENEEESLRGRGGLVRFGTDGDDRCISGIGESDEVAEELRGVTEHQVDGEDSRKSSDYLLSEKKVRKARLFVRLVTF